MSEHGLCCVECYGNGVTQGEHAGATVERETIVDGLRMIAEMVLKPSEYRDGYIQAMKDVADDILPNAPQYNPGENE